MKQKKGGDNHIKDRREQKRREEKRGEENSAYTNPDDG